MREGWQVSGLDLRAAGRSRAESEMLAQVERTADTPQHLLHHSDVMERGDLGVH